MKKIILFGCISCLLVACGGKPSGISDEFYDEYKILGAPKILYQCGEQIGYSAGTGMGSTYNHIVTEAKKECESSEKEFEILESQQYATDK
ncbi:MAG: hypothetical protein LDL19_04960 [Thiobacillus sp.]|nr:hypothetical protein [Thiobacillus sp.]